MVSNYGYLVMLIVSGLLAYNLAPRDRGKDFAVFRTCLTEGLGRNDILIVAPPQTWGQPKGPFEMDSIAYEALKEKKGRKWL